MIKTVAQYIANINLRYKLGNATEHTFRGDLQQLIENLVPEVRATNEPKRQLCGAPDYILTKKDIPVGFIEAKDIDDDDLDGKKRTGNKEQFDRYKASLNNLIFTDYINFHVYNDGQCVAQIAIAEVSEKGILALPQNFATFENLITDFCTHIGQTIKNPKKLAEMMAGKARLLSDVIEKSLTNDADRDEDSTLKDQMTAFKNILIHDITAKGFADVYAQTIAYGMFAARLHDPTLNTFSRQEAAELIPKSNPFLRKLFGYIAGPDIDDRIKWIVDSLVDIFLACNVEQILQNYGRATKMEDPIIHFYETFLAEYDPKLRKARGVWYTPAPVVNFIVRAVDDILKTDFNLPQGLANTSKTKITVDSQTADKRSPTGYAREEKEVHRVQILDPATGTGTFLAEVIRQAKQKFKGQEGIWSSYVENDLLPRLNGFELLMASYAMAHLQLDLLLKETGFTPSKNQRTRVYLTNSLEEYHPDTGTLFANWLSSEANAANHIKRDAPVMVVMGNPPYSGISSNKGKWISNLIEDYKYVDGVHFNERKHWLNDDYVKFLRYGQHFIEKNGSGILAFINPHGFLDNPTFRGMRWHLLKTYDKIYTIDLHGNSKKKERAPDGGVDQNVFDIMQGVSINLFIKTGKKKVNELGKVLHYDLFGKRELKYEFLVDNYLKDIKFKELSPQKPFVFFVPKDNIGGKDYDKGFKVNEIFNISNTGVITGIDRLAIFKTESELETITNSILNSEDPYTEFKIKDSRRISKEGRLVDLKAAKDRGAVKINYRPFDINYMYLPHKNEHWINSPRIDIMQHFLKGENLGLVFRRQSPESLDLYVFCSKEIIADGYIRSDNKGGESIAPLYLYPENKGQQTIEESTKRKPNLNEKIVNEIAKKLGLTFTSEKEPSDSAQGDRTTFASIDILDYIYAVLHSPTYREKYKEFLKIDFPKVPYPNDQTTFWRLIKLGGEIRQIHLLESPRVNDYITTYPKDGSNTITTRIAQKDWELLDKEKQLGRVWINEEQYFDNIPLTAWEFYIGGYQPAQKWLKDRKERTLSYDDILHYQKIIVALSETDRLMKKINKIDIEKEIV